MKTIQDLLNKQEELNSHLETKPTQEQLFMAFQAELGELSQSLKYGCPELGIEAWCWWKREDMKPSSKEKVIGEWIDCVHFAASNLTPKNEIWGDYKDREISMLLEDTCDFSEYIEHEIPDISKHFYTHAYACLTSTIHLGFLLNFTEKDFLKGFEASYQKNIERWK